MRSKFEEREQAVMLRRQGFSYGEIQKIIPVSQASLSLWLSSILLSKKQKVRLAHLSLKGQAAGAQARRTQRLVRLSTLTAHVKEELPQLLINPFFAFGLALYLAEGTKQKPWSISQRATFSNSDPALILMMRQWFQAFGDIPLEAFIYRLHIHQTANIPLAKRQWSKLLVVDPKQIHVTLKKHTVRSRHKHDDYKGLIHMVVRKSTWLNRRIKLWGQGAAEAYIPPKAE